MTDLKQRVAEVMQNRLEWPSLHWDLPSDDCVDALAEAVVRALGNDTDHIIQFEDHTFSVQHPLSERIDGSLFSCSVHQEIWGLDESPVPPGIYRVDASGPLDQWRFEPIRTEAADE